MTDITRELTFQNDIINEMVANGWVQGTNSDYQRETALYERDALDYVQRTQADEWDKFCRLFPQDPEVQFIKQLVKQLGKASEHATDRASRTYGTLGVLRHGLKIRNTRFSLCQFKPEHSLNPEVLARYEGNICRVVPEVVYSAHLSHKEVDEATGNTKSAKRHRIDLVLFVNGLPVVTMELKSEFKQAVENAKLQYKRDRLPFGPASKKPEPLLSFKRGALVHFAVSQYDVFMTTKLAGDDTFFLPFNKGTRDGGAGNDIPQDHNRYATDYLWNEVLSTDNLLNILGRFMHLQIEEKEDALGCRTKKETMIFPRYHQWDVVTNLVEDAVKQDKVRQAKQDNPNLNKKVENRYLIQHSAGSGKSNSIAWTAHQLSTLYNDAGTKLFDSVIVVTDRTVLDDQLQDTIYQFEHADGVVGRINRKEGEGSKSEKLAEALMSSQPIIIVTIQTFPYVLKAIEDSSVLKERRYAIIADEAHSSQSGTTARKLKEVLIASPTASDELRDNFEEHVDKGLSAEDMLDATITARRGSDNLSYYAFTATPKSKTLELFGRLPNPNLPASKDNKPEAYHVYSMRQAIEEGFILDVLKNYTSYKVVYQLNQTLKKDQEVDAKRAKIKLNQWVRLHDYNISQKVKIIIEHFNENIKGLLGGQAKAMVVTGSRKEAVRYKLAFDKYVSEHGYTDINAMVAFSGEVEFKESDPDSSGLLGESFTESNMNPGLKGRDMRKAFDSDDYQVMLVANKFQTGFDQPKLCAMYVDKKLAGVDCVQTLSRLNRIYPGKKETGTFVLDFFNDPEDILAAFQPYYETAELADVTDPDKVFDLFEKIRASDIIKWHEVDNLADAFYSKNKSNAAISNICKPAVERWRHQYQQASEDVKRTKAILERTKATNDAVLIGNADNDFKEAKKAQDELVLFKKDLGSFTRFYEFMSQIVDYDDRDLEKLSLYARHLLPLLREDFNLDDEIDLSNIEMTHYRVSKLKQQDLKLQEHSEDNQLEPASGLGTATPKDKKDDYLSEIIKQLNDIFAGEGFTEDDLVNYAQTIRDKMAESEIVMNQVRNNTKDQAMLGDFPVAIDDAMIDSREAHEKMMMHIFSDKNAHNKFSSIIYDMLSELDKSE
ncbi:type I restriction endonuclease subunit R [Psychrobacter sanguinis]|uniref:type I restriction endonuclease subunit R n=1 Tax=Psychrobacter sanguinis TaxID=861445 RepID=UPI00020C7E8D|nr:DEAD/DEAH box helicase family protein [Psychrobacter sanguinis]EGK11764.1 type III restriction enzyme, res subunit [Psychrobacter sp. 1501(2011)]MCD9151751.1 DEAD/DEAH box helicase family protein [Psychrobacter sanguinis]